MLGGPRFLKEAVTENDSRPAVAEAWEPSKNSRRMAMMASVHFTASPIP